MTDLVRMSPDEAEVARQRVKLENTRLIMELIESLKPYIDGTLGPVSPNHANSFLKAVREVGLLWDAYAKPAVQVEQVKGVDEELMVLESRQAQVSAELSKLREVGMRRRV